VQSFDAVRATAGKTGGKVRAKEKVRAKGKVRVRGTTRTVAGLPVIFALPVPFAFLELTPHVRAAPRARSPA
jgi:hypothetical protein